MEANFNILSTTYRSKKACWRTNVCLKNFHKEVCNSFFLKNDTHLQYLTEPLKKCLRNIPMPNRLANGIHLLLYLTIAIHI